MGKANTRNFILIVVMIDGTFLVLLDVRNPGANFMFPLLYSPLKLFPRPCLQTDCLYRALIEGDNTLPPTDGWMTFISGKEPAPQIKY
jgi:hypothetical protein